MTFSEGVFYRPLVWSLAIALLAGGALLSIQMISAVVGPFRLAHLGKSDPRAVVAFFRDSYTPVGSIVRTELGHGLVGSGHLVREVTSLRDLDPSEVGAIVISEPRVLQDDEAAGLRNYLAGGGGAVLVGSVGVREADGAWLGYERMRNLLGAEVVPLDEDRARAIVAERRGPITAALAPRQRIDIRYEEGLPGALITDAELSWAGPQDDADADAHEPAAALRREFGKGRLAWVAVGPERAATSGVDQRLLRAVLEGAVAWSSRMPAVEVLPWPGGAPFAGVVEAAADATAEQPGLGWQRAIDKAASDAGIARLFVLNEARRHDDTEQRLADAIGELDRRNAWVATRSEVSTWTRRRAAVTASVRRAGPHRVVVEVSNFGRTEASRVVLRVFLNQPALRAAVEATKLRQQAATVQLGPNAEVLDLVLPPLDPRSSAAFNLDYEPTPSQEG